MSTLKETSRSEKVAREGVIDGANVRVEYERENRTKIRRINAHANAQVADGGEHVNVFVDYQSSNRGITINVQNCGFDVPIGLIEILIAEMQAVNNEKSVE